MKLADHHILVTGGANGIGAAVVRDAALCGAEVSFVEQFGNVTGIVNSASVRANVDPVDMADEDWDAVFSVAGTKSIKTLKMANKTSVDGQSTLVLENRRHDWVSLARLKLLSPGN